MSPSPGRCLPLLRWLLLLPLLAAWLTPSLSEPAAAAFQNIPSGPADKKAPSAPAPQGLDGFKLPTDALILVCEQAADALRLLPKMVVLTPEKLKEMQDEIERLRSRLRADRPQPPSMCELKGKIEGQLVQLDVTYQVVTEKPGIVVALGFKQAQLDRLTLDGKTPLVRPPDAEGITVQIEKPGDHRLEAHYTMLLSVSGPTRSLEVDLPRAASTGLELHILGEVKELRVNEKALAETTLGWKGGLLKGSHGQFSDRLALTWKGSNSMPGGSAILTAESKVLVRIDEQRRLQTEAQFQLKVQGGTTKQWRLLLPSGSRLVLASADEEKLTVESQELPGASLRILRLKEPTAGPLAVTVVAPPGQTLSRTGTRLPIGPLALLGATRQTGSIILVNAAPSIWVQTYRPGTTTPRAPTAEESKLGSQVRAFSYELPALAEAPPFLDRSADLAALNLLELEGEPARGRLETRVNHALRLPRNGEPGALAPGAPKRSWQLATTLEVKQHQPGATLLEVQLPAEWSYVPSEARWPDPVTEVRLDEERKVIQIRLLPDSWKPFQLTLRARSNRPLDEGGKESRELPRPLGIAIAPGFQVSANVSDDLELYSVEGSNPLLELSQPGPQEQVWRLESAADQTPRQIELAWHPYRPRVRAGSVVDLNLIGTQAHVLQELRLHYPQTAPTTLPLRVPAELVGPLKLIEGGTLLPERGPLNPRGPLRLLELTPPERGRSDPEVRLVLEYWIALPDLAARKPGEQGPLRLPLITAEDSTFGETRVRIWCDPGVTPEPAGAGWAIKELEEVKGNRRLPSLVLLSGQPEQVLPLNLTASPAASGTSVLIERALVRVNIVEGIGQFYRTSYRLTRLSSHQIDVALPAAADTIHLQVTLDGKVVPLQVRDDPDLPAEEGAGRLVRLERLAPLVKPDSLLEIGYQLPPPGLAGRGGLLQTVLLPPVVRGSPPRVLTRWQVSVPAGWVVLGPEGSPGSERSWGRRGLLLAPRLAITSADLDRWLVGPDGTLPASRAEEPEGVVVPALTCWRGGQEPLAVVHLPQQAWLLFCSLVVVLLGLAGAVLIQRSRNSSFRAVWMGLALAALGLGAVLAGVFWPTLLAAIFYGWQPGLVVLALILLVQWLLHERHRRQLVFLPSFSRRAGSSLGPAGKTSSDRRAGVNPRSSGAHAPREPSTIDEPKSA
jgi:hypothetical protein